MTVFNAVLPVVTLVIGYLGTLVTEGARDKRAARREGDARTAADAKAAASLRASSELWVLDRALADIGDVWEIIAATGQFATAHVTAAVVSARSTYELILDPDVRSKYEDALVWAEGGMTVPQAAGDEAARTRLIDSNVRGAFREAQQALGERMRALISNGATLPEVSPEYQSVLRGHR